MAEISSWDLSEIKRGVLASNINCCRRGLMHSAKWAAELCYALDQVNISEEEIIPLDNKDYHQEYDRYILAKSYFDLREYDRAAHFLQSCTTPLPYFLHMYSKYLAGEKKAQDNVSDSIGQTESVENENLKSLRVELYSKHKRGELDGYLLYLYAVVLKKLDLLQEAVEVFVEAVNSEPLLWSAWQELALLVTDKDMLENLSVPKHWMKYFFTAHAYLELQLNEEGLLMYQTLSQHGFSRSTYVMSKIALAFHNIKDVDLAVEAFDKLQNVDPYRLDNMDTYSNLLYVKEMRKELAHLAHHCCDVDKYRVETCCVIGNYYSLRSQHEKAALYFQRALKLNPNYLSAWTLMGHEYMELKNTPAAIQAYRQAIEINKRDYRAWYGLGQTYEILKMPQYCLYYFRKAQMLRPNDSRMVVALGEAYEKLERLQEAKKCFWKAHSIGDVEGTALIKLAKLYERLDEKDQAAAAYTEYINETERQGLQNHEEQSQAYRYLANYHLKMKNMDDAYVAAQKCTEYNETREEAKAILREISWMRSQGLDKDGGLESGSALLDRGERIPPEQRTPESHLLPTSLTFTP